MKKLIRKLHKTKKLPRYMYYILSTIYLISFILFAKTIINLKGIETIIRVIGLIFFSLYFLLYVLWGLLNLVQKKYKINYILHFITIIFIIAFLGCSYYINFIYAKIDNIYDHDELTYESYLVIDNDIKLNDNLEIGRINNEEDVEGYILANKLYKKENLKNEIKTYDSYNFMLKDFLEGKIKAIFVPSNYVERYKNEEGLEGIVNKGVIHKKYSEKRKNENLETISNKDFNDPLTLLIMGVDSMYNGLKDTAAFNGDTLMIITINPHNLETKMLSIPRDTYVPIACNRNHYAKINSAAGYSTKCVLNTVENFLDINIDYYIKINFKGVVELVDAIGGIEVDVEKPDYNWHKNLGINCNGRFCEQNSNRGVGHKDVIYINPGIQKLNGEQALAYSRSRYLYTGGDLDRIKHQQQVVEALFKKLLSFSTINDLQNILEVISNNIVTNMDRDKILSGYSLAKKMLGNVLDGNDFITINKMHLETYGLYTYVAAHNTYTSALGFYEDSLDEIKDSLKETLEIKKINPVKTFNFSVNEKFEISQPGSGKRSEKSSVLLPDFVGKTVSDAEKYCKEYDIELKISYVDQNSEFYNPDVLMGEICNQSIHKDSHLSTFKELTIYIKNSEQKETSGEPNISDENGTNEKNINDYSNKIIGDLIN